VNEEKVENHPAASTSCEQIPSKINTIDAVTKIDQKDILDENFNQTSTDIRDHRIETNIDENYCNSEDSDNDDDDDSTTSSRIKIFEEDIDRHMHMAQDEEEYHLLELYRLMKRKDRSALLRGAEKLARIHKTNPI
jgi:hypothetical protein